MKLITNTGALIDWDSIVESLSNQNGHILHYNTESFPNTSDFNGLDAAWQKAGYRYNDASIEGINYFPKEHFDQSVVDTFQSIVDAEPWMVWISRIRPGKMAPWHFDAHSKISELLALNRPIVRYTCYIQPPSNGHVSIVGTTALYRPEQGSIYEWPSYDAWHCGMNGGLNDKYMFNYWGYR